MPKVLTNAAVERLKPAKTRREVRDGGMQSLYLVIQPSGVKSWAMRFRRPNGKPVKLTLGPVFFSGKKRGKRKDNGTETTEPAPVLGAPLTLVGARRLAGEVLHARAMGKDVAAQHVAVRRRRRLDAAERAHTAFAALTRRFIDEHARPATRRWRGTASLLGWQYPRDDKEEPSIVRGSLSDRWRDQEIDIIGADAVADVVDEAERKGVPGVKVRNRGTSRSRGRALARCLSKFFAWLKDRRLVGTNPCVGMRAPDAPPARDRVLTASEIRLVWRACDEIGEPFGALIKLLLLTGARREEVTRMTRTELSEDGGTWSLPGARTKNGKPHVVPLAPLAREIIEGLTVIEGAAGFVFTTTGKTPVSGFSKIKRRIDKKMLEIAREDAEKAGRDPKTVGVAPWRLHDLRRTAATTMAERGTPPHIVELVLNHVSGARAGVAGIYNRALHLQERRDALEQWATYVAAMVAGGNVVALPSRRKATVS